MAKVFVAGSRNISRLSLEVRAKLDEMMRRRSWFLVGDANGADKAFQAYLAKAQYPQVTVYHVGKCRNNLGGWPVKTVVSPAADRGFAYYAAKDAAMAQDADCGFMLWDEKSKGTFNNIETLMRLSKKTLVYLSTQKGFYRLVTKRDFEDFLRQCEPGLIATLQKEIRGKLAGRGQMNLIAAS